MRPEPLIRIAQLRSAFGTTPVLDSVTMDIGAGETVALLGVNGAGKTTLLRILATLVRPTGGSAQVAGADVVREAESVRRHVGLLGHGSFLYEELSALENLRFWTAFAGRPTPVAALRALLADVELDQVADERVRPFSAGMKRRLSLARLIALEPRVLLLDEPFAALDHRARKWLEEYLRSFKETGGAVLMATHSFTRDIAIADRVAILANGRIALDQPRAALSAEELQRLYMLHTEELV